jgi:DNA-binding winged helix-turn-helix (wHTH) protein/tetratricopeptide (TPR) repeat protein
MATTLFRFGAFRLDAQARELFEHDRRIDLPLTTIDCLLYLIRHRDRPVGRDELAAAVWGRADVSEVSLTHAVMRLRRVLGDDGIRQRCIRTVPRLGYRWVGDLVEAAGAPPRAADVAVSEPPPPPPPPPPAPRPRPLRRAALVLGAALLLAALLWTLREAAPPSPVGASDEDVAMVMPVTVEAGADWAWLRLGLMDLVAAQLRGGRLATVPSESVVALVEARARGGNQDEPSATLRVQPQVTLRQGVWHVRLDAQGRARTLTIEASDGDPVRAARAAADELLIKLGHAPPPAAGDDAALAEATLRQRVNAAVLAGQIDVARRLIAEAPAALRASPAIALSQASIAFFAGEYAACQQQVEHLLQSLPAARAPELRARALNTLGAAAFRLGRIDTAERAYAESIDLMQDGHVPDLLAKAYIGSGGVASQRDRLEQAAADYGRARTLLELVHDAFGVAAVDLNLGMNAMQRGQPAAALPLLRSAAGRFEAFAAGDALAATEVAVVEAELALLDYPQALAGSTRLAAIEATLGNPRQHWELALARARALGGVGQLGAAQALLARLLDGSDADKDAVVRAKAQALAAALALERGDAPTAVDASARALTPALEAYSRDSYVDAWLVHLRALRRAGRTAEAAAQTARLDAWSGPAAPPFERIRVVVADAEQAAAEGQQERALRGYEAAMNAAVARAIPEELVLVGYGYVRRLLAAGRVDQAASVNGRIAPWADRDMRAAASEALVYAALGKPGAAAAARERAQRLAGERRLEPAVATAE